MTRQRINSLCAMAPIYLSVLACTWVLGNVAGGLRSDGPGSGGGEGLGFHIFWLLIFAQLPFMAGYLLTADWQLQGRAAGRLALQAAALLVAFAPVAYFRL